MLSVLELLSKKKRTYAALRQLITLEMSELELKVEAPLRPKKERKPKVQYATKADKRKAQKARANENATFRADLDENSKQLVMQRKQLKDLRTKLARATDPNMSALLASKRSMQSYAADSPHSRLFNVSSFNVTDNPLAFPIDIETSGVYVNSVGAVTKLMIYSHPHKTHLGAFVYAWSEAGTYINQWRLVSWLVPNLDPSKYGDSYQSMAYLTRVQASTLSAVSNVSLGGVVRAQIINTSNPLMIKYPDLYPASLRENRTSLVSLSDGASTFVPTVFSNPGFDSVVNVQGPISQTCRFFTSIKGDDILNFSLTPGSSNSTALRSLYDRARAKLAGYIGPLKIRTRLSIYVDQRAISDKGYLTLQTNYISDQMGSLTATTTSPLSLTTSIFPLTACDNLDVLNYYNYCCIDQVDEGVLTAPLTATSTESGYWQGLQGILNLYTANPAARAFNIYAPVIEIYTDVNLDAVSPWSAMVLGALQSNQQININMLSAADVLPTKELPMSIRDMPRVSKDELQKGLDTYLRNSGTLVWARADLTTAHALDFKGFLDKVKDSVGNVIKVYQGAKPYLDMAAPIAAKFAGL